MSIIVHDTDPATAKKLADYARKLRNGGMSEPEIRRAVDALEKRLGTEAQAERAPQGMSERDLAAINFERSFQGLDPILPHPEDLEAERANTDRHRDLTDAAIADLNFQRAIFGKPPLTPNEIVRLNLERTLPTSTTRAPKGIHAVQLARENLDRACRGLPELVIDDEEDE